LYGWKWGERDCGANGQVHARELKKGRGGPGGGGGGWSLFICVTLCLYALGLAESLRFPSLSLAFSRNSAARTEDARDCWCIGVGGGGRKECGEKGEKRVEDRGR